MRPAACFLVALVFYPALSRGADHVGAAPSLIEIRNRLLRDDENGARFAVDQLLAAEEVSHAVRAAWGLQEDARAELAHRKPRAVMLQEWAVELWNRSLGPSSLEAGLGMQRLAEVYAAVGANGKADDAFQDAIKVLETAKGSAHPALSGVLRSYAEYLAAMSHPERAEPVLKRLLEIKEAHSGADSPVLAEDLVLYERLLRKLNRTADAENIRARRTDLTESKQQQRAGAPGFQPPRIVNQVEPMYTPLARSAEANANPRLAMIVDEEGNPQKIWVLRWAGLGLDEQAVEAVRRWKFQPAMRDGKPVLMHAVVEINFRIL